MSIKKYINMILLKLSEEYKITYLEIITYKEFKKYKNIKVLLNKKGKKTKTVEAYNERDLLLKLKEMM